MPPEKVAEMKAKIEAEKNALKQKTDIAEEERDKAARELEKREKEVQQAELVEVLGCRLYEFPLISVLRYHRPLLHKSMY